MSGRALLGARGAPAALTVNTTLRQHSDQHHRRPHPQPGPFPVKRAAAPCSDLREHQREHGTRQHCSRGPLKREPAFRQSSSFSIHFACFCREHQPDRTPNARALRGSRAFRVGPGACARGTFISYSAVAIPTKLFPRRSHMTYTLHWQHDSVCTACVHAWEGETQILGGWETILSQSFTPVLA